MSTSYASATPGQDRPTDLYRFYDSSDRLLYVGISFHAAARASDHKRDKAWWPEVAYMKVEHLPTRREALTAERKAIWTERPVHNVANAQDGPRVSFILPPEAKRWKPSAQMVSQGQYRPALDLILIPRCEACGGKHKHGVRPFELVRGWMDRFPHCYESRGGEPPWQRIYFPAWTSE